MLKFFKIIVFLISALTVSWVSSSSATENRFEVENEEGIIKPLFHPISRSAQIIGTDDYSLYYRKQARRKFYYYDDVSAKTVEITVPKDEIVADYRVSYRDEKLTLVILSKKKIPFSRFTRIKPISSSQIVARRYQEGQLISDETVTNAGVWHVGDSIRNISGELFFLIKGSSTNKWYVLFHRNDTWHLKASPYESQDFSAKFVYQFDEIYNPFVNFRPSYGPEKNNFHYVEYDINKKTWNQIATGDWGKRVGSVGSKKYLLYKSKFPAELSNVNEKTCQIRLPLNDDFPPDEIEMDVCIVSDHSYYYSQGAFDGKRLLLGWSKQENEIIKYFVDSQSDYFSTRTNSWDGTRDSEIAVFLKKGQLDMAYRNNPESAWTNLTNGND